jgi:bifunctional DNA-binding transcriptional regulator/antitoxin component of YhaV-PrlF toxin-antitoxin module
VTSKLQVTIPKALAVEYGIEPGDDVEWSASGDAVRLSKTRVENRNVRARLRLFDQATLRQRAREGDRVASPASSDRGWTREDLYHRGRSR